MTAKAYEKIWGGGDGAILYIYCCVDFMFISVKAH